MKKETTKTALQVRTERTLENFDLLLWAVDRDCGTNKLFREIKKQVKRAIKAVHNVPKPKGWV